MRGTWIPAVFLLLAAGCTQSPVESEPPAHDSPDIPTSQDLLAATADEPLLWQILSAPSVAPEPAVAAAVSEAMDEVFGPDAHRRLPSTSAGVPPTPEGGWEDHDLFELASRLHARTGGDRLHVVFLEGTHAQPDAGRVTLGIEILQVAFVFPEQTGHAWAGEVRVAHTAETEIMRSVAVHEVGHALGLVGREAPMLEPRLPPAKDDPCQCHSDREDSVMYYMMETEGWYEEVVFQDGRTIPYRFDEHDLADLAHARETALERRPDATPQR